MLSVSKPTTFIMGNSFCMRSEEPFVCLDTHAHAHTHLRTHRGAVACQLGVHEYLSFLLLAHERMINYSLGAQKPPAGRLLNRWWAGLAGSWGFRRWGECAMYWWCRMGLGRAPCWPGPASAILAVPCSGHFD